MKTLTLDQACKEAVVGFTGGIEAVARATGIRSLQQKLNTASDRNKLSAGDVEQILKLTRSHEILDVICGRVDAAWVDLTELDNLPCDTSMLDNITDLITRVGALTQNVQESLADGVVDKTEMIELERASMRLVRASLTVVERSKQFMEDDVESA